MRFIAVLSTLLFMSQSLYSQKIVKAYVVDQNSLKAITNAEIYIDDIKTTITKANGYFEYLINSKQDTFLLIRKTGYNSINKHLPSLNPASIDTFYMQLSESDVKEEAEIIKSDILKSPVKSERFKVESDAVGDVIKSEKREAISYMHSYDKKSSSDLSATSVVANGGPAPKAGLLTAGEVNDFSKWNLWEDLGKEEFAKWESEWQLTAKNRYTVQLLSANNKAVSNAKISLLHKDNVIWKAVSDNTGKAELWLNANLNDAIEAKKLRIKIDYQGQTYSIKRAKPFNKKINTIELDAQCNRNELVDIAFVVDATGSMGDEINYLKKEILDIINRAQDTLPYAYINLASIFYKDVTDDYLTKYSQFSSDFTLTSEFINMGFAAGGGDMPEAVDAALEVALDSLEWRDGAAKLLFLVLDAPPHQTAEYLNKMQLLVQKAAEKGIRIIPVACSGINKSTEYLMRTIALLTNGTYTFLTDHSGIGNSHIEPSTDEYQVEYLNDMLVRLIYQMSYMPECNMLIPDSMQANDTSIVEHQNHTPKDSYTVAVANPINIKWEYFPNPSNGIIYVKTDGFDGTLYLSDMNGKALQRHQVKMGQQIKINLKNYPDGIYLIRYEYKKDRWLSGKVILKR